MRAVGGTVKQEIGAKNIIVYAYLSVGALFEHSPKIDMYITRLGRIVTKCGIPWSTITKVRENDDMGTEINMNPWQAPPPSAPAGGQSVRSRDSKGGSPCPRGPIIRTFPRRTARLSPRIVTLSLGLVTATCFQEIVLARPGNSTASSKCLRVSTRLPSATTSLGVQQG